jgi:hypothetical protein
MNVFRAILTFLSGLKLSAVVGMLLLSGLSIGLIHVLGSYLSSGGGCLESTLVMGIVAIAGFIGTAIGNYTEPRVETPE